MLPQKDISKYTYKDCALWPENERWEIINGIPYLHAAPSWQHQRILSDIHRQISSYLVDKSCTVFVAPFDLCLAEYNENDDDISTVLQPDILIVCDKTKLRKTGYFGVPTFIIEITSPSTAQRDKLYKFNLYEKYGVKEYWIVEPEQKIVSVFILQSNNRYGRPENYTHENNIQLNVFPELIIDLKTVFQDL